MQHIRRTRNFYSGPRAWLATLGLAVTLAAIGSHSHVVDDPLRAAVDSELRTPAYRDRDESRHPYETLQFFRLRPDQTVVEIWPAGGWYSEIIAPYLQASGTYYAAHFSPTAELDYYRRSLATFKDKIAASEQQYSKVKLVSFDPDHSLLAVPPESADRVLTFRNVHNWLRSESEQTAFDLFFTVLKPGGILGVVEHRGNPGITRDEMLATGYMDEDSMIAAAVEAGFILDGRSDINANLHDTKDHPQGVWTLPPSLRLGDQGRERYQAIGESDRMTLRFRKPENGAVPSRD